MERDSVIIRKASMLSSAGLVPRTDIRVSGGRIVEVGPELSGLSGRSARVLDADGDTLLPGLVDAHVHLFGVGGLPSADFGLSSAETLSINARQLLSSGVTTARVHLFDVEYGPRLAAQSRDDSFPAPRLTFGGPGLTGGQPSLEGFQMWGVRSAEDVHVKVRRARSVGADWIALHDVTKFEEEELTAIRSAAVDHRVKLMTQGYSEAEIRAALACGSTSIEYLDRTRAAHYSESLLDEVSSAPWSVHFVPTIGRYYSLKAYYDDPDRLDEPRITSFMPHRVARELVSKLRSEVAAPTLREQWDAEPDLETLAAKFRQLLSSGLRIASGTDCGSLMQFPSEAIWWELRTWVELGASLERAIDGATRASSDLLGLLDIGRVEVGARADLVLYRGALDEGELDVGRVRTVMKGGVVFVDEGSWVE